LHLGRLSVVHVCERLLRLLRGLDGEAAGLCGLGATVSQVGEVGCRWLGPAVIERLLGQIERLLCRV